jgi:ABC-2 type transport system ATP-binding protein
VAERSTQVAIQTYDLSKHYKDVVALQSLNLNVEPNTIFGFLGPNGAGKTTTIKLLLGLARPTSGSAKVFGKDIFADSVGIRRQIGYLAQNPRYYDYMSARETLRLRARFFFSGPKPAIEERITSTLDMVGLADKADRPIKGFSGGELQRLGIAQAQVNYPDLLILDEPAANLDPQGRRDVLAVMDGLRKYTTIFYSTHILNDVQQVSDDVAILNHGRLIAQAPLEELLAGSDGTVFTLTTEGDTSNTEAKIAEQSWVSGIRTATVNSQTRWQVTVSNEEDANNRLLRMVLSDENLRVLEYGRKKYELEEVFLDLVKGDGDDNK